MHLGSGRRSLPSQNPRPGHRKSALHTPRATAAPTAAAQRRSSGRGSLRRRQARVPSDPASAPTRAPRHGSPRRTNPPRPPMAPPAAVVPSAAGTELVGVRFRVVSLPPLTPSREKGRERGAAAMRTALRPWDVVDRPHPARQREGGPEHRRARREEEREDEPHGVEVKGAEAGLGGEAAGHEPGARVPLDRVFELQWRACGTLRPSENSRRDGAGGALPPRQVTRSGCSRASPSSLESPLAARTYSGIRHRSRTHSTPKPPPLVR